MSYQCPIQIEFTPRGGSSAVLVAAGGWLAELPQIAAEQQLYEAEGVLLADGFFRPLGSAVVSFTLAIETDEATRLAAQNAFSAVALQGSGGLSFIAETWRCDFPQAVISEITPALPSGTPAATLVRSLQITCGLPAYSLIP